MGPDFRIFNSGAAPARRYRGSLAGFTHLVATAIANAQARVELRGFAEDQAALRRVATWSRGMPQEEVFSAVTVEAGQVLGVDFASLAGTTRTAR